MSDIAGNRAVWFDIPCGNLDRGIAFYEAVLGFTIHRQEVGEGAIGVIPHEGAAVGGCLVVDPDNPPGDHGVVVYLNCDGRLDDAIAAVEPNGGAVLEPKHSIGPHGWVSVIRDSEGNRIALHSM